jgi:flagellar biosynthesis chaperone FliJ
MDYCVTPKQVTTFKKEEAKKAAKKTAKKHANFGDLSFLRNMAAFKQANAARARFVKEHMRLAARRHHHTLAYFKAHHHAGYVRNLMNRFAKSLKARVAAHHRAIRAHAVAKKHRANAKRARAHAHAAMRRAHAHHVRAIRSVHAASSRVHRANRHVRNMAKNLKMWRGKRAQYIKKRQHAMHVAHLWLNKRRARAAHLRKMIHHQHRAAAADRRAAAAATRAWRHRQATAKKLGFSKVEFATAMRRFRASKAAAIRANNKVHAHAIKGMKAGHMLAE